MRMKQFNVTKHLSLFLVLLFAVAVQEAACRCSSENHNARSPGADMDEGRIFTALLASKFSQQAVQQFVPQAPQTLTSTVSTAPASPTTTVTSSFTTPTTVAVPPAVAAIGGPGAALSSDDPEDGGDGAFLRNRLRENYAIDLEELINNNQEIVSSGRADTNKVAEQNAALKRQLQRNNRRWQMQQKRNAIRRRNRAAAKRRKQRARKQAINKRKQYRKNRVKQDSINRKRRRNLQRGPAKRKIIRRVIA